MAKSGLVVNSVITSLTRVLLNYDCSICPTDFTLPPGSNK